MTLEDDLVDVCKPGDDVTVIGVVKRRWQPLGRGRDGRTEIELCLRANYIEVNNDRQARHLITEEQVAEFRHFWEEHAFNPLEGRLKILSSFCPQVYGLYAVKLATAVVLTGGVERVDEGGTRVRGESHMVKEMLRSFYNHHSSFAFHLANGRRPGNGKVPNPALRLQNNSEGRAHHGDRVDRGGSDRLRREGRWGVAPGGRGSRPGRRRGVLH